VVGDVREEANPLPLHARMDGTMTGRKTMYNFYNACLYDVLQGTKHNVEIMATLNQLKAKIVRLPSTRLQRGTIDTHDPGTIQGK
jgi:hypothetical protein